MEISVKPNCKIAIFAQKHQDTPKSAKITYAHRANALYIYTQMHPCSNVRLSGVSNGNGPQCPPPLQNTPYNHAPTPLYKYPTYTILAWAFYYALVRGVFFLSPSPKSEDYSYKVCK